MAAERRCIRTVIWLKPRLFRYCPTRFLREAHHLTAAHHTGVMGSVKRSVGFDNLA